MPGSEERASGGVGADGGIDAAVADLVEVEGSNALEVAVAASAVAFLVALGPVAVAPVAVGERCGRADPGVPATVRTSQAGNR